MACSSPADVICNAVDVIDNVVNGAVQVAVFASDPLGWLVQRLQEGVHALAALVIPYILGALEPDYSAEWWLTSYAVSFGIAVVVLAFLMIVTATRRVRGEIGPRALMESYFLAAPGFLIGAMFGPLLGIVITRLFVGISSALTLFFFDSSSSDFWKAFADRITNPDASKLAGSVLLAVLMYLVLVASLLGVVFILVIQLATQYLVGALIPLAIVWLVNPDTRHLAKVGPLIWVSILASHVLLILVLGIAFKATNALFLEAGDTPATERPMEAFVNIAVPTVLMAMVVFAPMRLLSLARFTSPSNGGGMSSQGGFSPPTQAPQPGRTALNAQQAAAQQSRGGSPSSNAAPGPVTTSATNTSNTTTNAAAQASNAASAAKAGAGATAGAGAGATAAGATAAGATAGGGALASTAGASLLSGVGAPLGLSLLMVDAALKMAHRASQAAEQAASQAADAGDERD